MGLLDVSMAPVAQLDRAVSFHGTGRWFEPSRERHELEPVAAPTVTDPSITTQVSPQGDDRGSNIARQAGPFYPLLIDRLMTIRVRTLPECS